MLLEAKTVPANFLDLKRRNLRSASRDVGIWYLTEKHEKGKSRTFPYTRIPEKSKLTNISDSAIENFTSILATIE